MKDLYKITYLYKGISYVALYNINETSLEQIKKLYKKSEYQILSIKEINETEFQNLTKKGLKISTLTH